MRLIDGNALIAILEEIAVKDEAIYFHLDEITQEIFDAPTVDALPVVHGWWEDMDFDPKCSVCGKFAVNDKHAVKYYEYCPHCGAKMEFEV